jgi:hypothetical protein
MFVEGLVRAPSDGRSTVPRSPLREALLAEPPEDPSEFGELLALFGAAAAQAIETAGPAYLGYVPGGGLYVSALAEFLARSANRFTGLAATAPELAAMEHGVLRWLCRTFSLPGTGATAMMTPTCASWTGSTPAARSSPPAPASAAASCCGCASFRTAPTWRTSTGPCGSSTPPPGSDKARERGFRSPSCSLGTLGSGG